MKKYNRLGVFFLILGACSILSLSMTSGAFGKNVEVAPMVNITSPQDGAIIYENSLSVMVNFCPKEKGKGNVRTIELKLDGELVATYNNPAHIKEGTYTFTLDITDLPDGEHTLQAFAYQAEERAMHEGSSEVVTFTFTTITRVIAEIEEICIQAEDMESAGWSSAPYLNELVAIGKPAVPQLLEFVKDKSKDEKARCLAIMALDHVKDERAIEPLIYILQDDSESSIIRQVTINALGQIGDPWAVTPLISSLSSPDVEIQRRAAINLGILKDEQAVEALINVLENEDDGLLRQYAAGALGSTGDARAVEPLITAFEKGAIVPDSLAEIGTERAIEYLIGKCNAKPTVHLVRALGITGDARAVEPLIQALGNEDGLIIRYAARALGEIGDERAVGPLEEALERTKADPTTGKRGWIIADALKKITGQNYEY